LKKRKKKKTGSISERSCSKRLLKIIESSLEASRGIVEIFEIY